MVKTLVHFSRQRKQLSRDTLGSCSGSVAKQGSGLAEKWTRGSPWCTALRHTLSTDDVWKPFLHRRGLTLTGSLGGYS